MPDSTKSAAPGVKRACDACHRRKVKCVGDGTAPCRNCEAAGLTCNYNTVPQKKGPKGSRAKVISELRETQRRSQLTGKCRDLEPDGSPPHSPMFPGTVGLLSATLVNMCVDYFIHHLYQHQPVLHRQSLLDIIAHMDTRVDAYCLTASLCAYVMMQPNMRIPPETFQCYGVTPPSNFEMGYAVLQKAVRARRDCNDVENPTIWSVLTSLFLFEGYSCLDSPNTAWFHLREATTLAQLMGMHEESSYHTAHIAQDGQKRRLYWLLLVKERETALQQHRPITLHATIHLPTADLHAAGAAEVNGFIHLIQLFRPFDDTFFAVWNRARTDCTIEWLAFLQQQLLDVLPSYLHCTPSQAIHLQCTQQWLRTLVWRLSLLPGCLPSPLVDRPARCASPLDTAHDLVRALPPVAPDAVASSGPGLAPKLFDIARALIDISPGMPAEPLGFDGDPRTVLHQLMVVLSSLPGGRHRYLPLLMQRIHDTTGAGALSPLTLLPTSAADGPFYTTASFPSAMRSDSSSSFDSPLSAGTESFGFSDVAVHAAASLADGAPALSLPAYARETGGMELFPVVTSPSDFGMHG